jgi:hypothetical protein
MKLAAQAVKSMCDLKNLKVHWTANVTAFDEALEVITRTLKGFRPHELAATNLVTERPELGKPALVEIVREIQAADPTRPLGKLSKRERAISSMTSWGRSHLGSGTCGTTGLGAFARREVHGSLSPP